MPPKEVSTDSKNSTPEAEVLGLNVGTKCYLADDKEVWLQVRVEEVDWDAKTAVLCNQNDDTDRRTIPLDQAAALPLQNTSMLNQESDSPRAGVDDLIELNHLHEAAILYNLKERFHCQTPYTYTGDICLAVNPYQWLEHLYSKDMHEKYLSAKKSKDLPPHIYAMSVDSYKRLCDDGQNQSILVSGESGAGKTETTKLLMDHVASIAGGMNNATIKRIVEANPLLESFGNAKTVRNDNSSRFGKFTQLQFDDNFTLCGAQCETYLLEKTRVVSQEPGERNYHIFYQLFRGATDEERQKYGLDGREPSSFTYLLPKAPSKPKKKGQPPPPPTEDAKLIARDGKNLDKTKKALGLLNLSEEQQSAIFETIAGILHLGQIEFVANEDDDEASHLVESSAQVSGMLLGLDISAMNKALSTRTMKAGGEVYAVPLDASKAESCRDALAKAVYANLFDWMVELINESLGASGEARGTIGVLDIFGFESFEHNSFEQLCINYANEKLQQKFTQDVFRAVQEEYENEKITWAHITYPDNTEVLALIEGRMGVISLLNEEIVRPKGNAEGFVSKLSSSNSQRKSVIAFPRISRTQFTIHHYAAAVTYEADGFLEKHKDALFPDLSNLMLDSSHEFVCQVFKRKVLIAKQAEAVAAMSGSKGSRAKNDAAGSTVGSQFKTSLNKLMETINDTGVSYIRCIKPNSSKSAEAFELKMVVDQLRCAGVIEAIQIARAGYPNRLRHAEFASEFDIFLSDQQIEESSADANCQFLVKQFKLQTPEEYQMGVSKIYLQKGVLERVQHIKAQKLFAYAASIQSRWRGIDGRQIARERYAALLLLQEHCRVFAAMIKFWRQKRAVRAIQRLYRGHQGRKLYFAALCQLKALQIQRVWRGRVGRKLYFAFLCDVRARKIQRVWRGHVGRQRFHTFLCEAKALELQRVWRGHVGRQICHEARRQRSATTIQAMVRCLLAKAELKRRIVAHEEEVERQRLLEIQRQEEAKAEEQRQRKQRALEMRKRRENGATTVQRYVRGYLGRCRFQRILEEERAEQQRLLEFQRIKEDMCAVFIQSAARGFLTRKHVSLDELRFERNSKAALVIQTTTRVFMARLYVSRLRQERMMQTAASTVIQSVVRGCIARKQVAAIHEQLRVQSNAATMVQKTIRGKLARKRYAILKEHWNLERGMTLLQAVVRGKIERRRYEHLRQAIIASIAVQKIVRGWLARRQLQKLRMDKENMEERAVIYLQSIARGYLARTAFATMMQQKIEIDAVVLIQAVGRRYLARTAFVVMVQERMKNDSIVLMQAVVRGYLARTAFATMMQQMNKDNSVVRMQAVVRGFLARTKVAGMVQERIEDDAIVLMQAVGRGYLARVKFTGMVQDRIKNDAAVLMQAVVRSYLARKHASAMMTTVVSKEEVEMERNRLEEERNRLIDQYQQLVDANAKLEEMIDMWDEDTNKQLESFREREQSAKEMIDLRESRLQSIRQQHTHLSEYLNKNSIGSTDRESSTSDPERQTIKENADPNEPEAPKKSKQGMGSVMKSARNWWRGSSKAPKKVNDEDDVRRDLL